MDIIQGSGPLDWLEVHAENYMGNGGRPIAQLHQLSEKFHISVHALGFRLGTRVISTANTPRA